jgi:hypothetical protein
MFEPLIFPVLPPLKWNFPFQNSHKIFHSFDKTSKTGDFDRFFSKNNYSIYNPINLPELERTWINQFIAVQGRLPILNKVNSPIS